MPFIDTVMQKGHLENAFDAKQVSELVFRTMRDLMTREASERVAAELPEEEVPTKDKPIQDKLTDLWQDTDPVAGFMSKVREPQKFDADSFLFRIRQEADLPQGVDVETAVSAVFSATKEKLSLERNEEIATWLPDKIKQMWEAA
ncbi:MAG: DUF2267 domain-containing protein [Kastovskya adunca ATA6-11-RM4]|jgi:uncharacterized protein (DUF2267 family)|nr:DUF2267 domain-containing protein [Kastovskya adunca ATA6-11-RM4]